MTCRQQISVLLRKCGAGLYWIASRVYRAPKKTRVAQWFADKGDETLRLDYELDENSLIFDLGGYKGQWASDIYAMYCCRIHIFEPVQEFAQEIKKRFRKNSKISVHQCGLGSKNEVVEISVNGTSSSIFKPGNDRVEARLARASDFMDENDVRVIDLMKINIEGGEYDLLEHLTNLGYVERIKNIQVQFHDFVADAERRMQRIQMSLSQTHYLTYQYPFVWENWKQR